MASKIAFIDKGSPAERAGIKEGETLISIGRKAIQDVLDYKFYTYDPDLELRLQGSGGAERTVWVRKREGEPLGLNFETYLMDSAKRCSNRCVFCFIDQLPRNLRETLYFKDDDARLSFLMGNYISLTNISQEDVARILRMRISPVNISVQATDPQVRVKMLGNPRAGEALKIMEQFAEGRIEMNCQIVLCPGLNDGAILERSLNDLERLYPSVNSISVVPVGLTAHRKNLYPLEPVTREKAREIVESVERFGEACLEKYGTRLAFCGDELYIKAGLPLPDTEFYEEFTQFENGVGMLSLFMEEFFNALPDGKQPSPAPFSIATGTAAGPYLAKLLDAAAARCDNLNSYLYEIENEFFGGGVSVAGLLTGGDLIRQLSGRPLGQRLLLSANMLRDGGDVFLDGMTPQQVEHALGVPVKTVKIDGGELVREIFSKK